MTLQRVHEIKFGGQQIRLPIYFPSVSSVKTSMRPLEYILILSALQAKQFLVSAYDLYHADPETQRQIQAQLSKAIKNGATVLMDSGKYESYWSSKGKPWSQENFHRVIVNTICTFAFGFDDQSPPDDFSTHVRLICDQYKVDQTVILQPPIIPIIHGKSGELPALCSKIADLTGAVMIAIPERRLGDGIFMRAKCVAEIRKALNETGKYIPLHLLGTGNPISIAIYTLAGADSFDGLEWCQTVVDHETATLFHFSHADFFQKQTPWGDFEMGFQPRSLAHNLEFYERWMERLSQSIHDNRGIEFCKLHFPDRIYSVCADVLGWEL